MTVIRSNSISGINSITAQSASLNFYDTSGNTLSIGANVTGNVTGNLTGTASTATAAATAYGISGSPTLSGITSVSTTNLTVNGNAYPSAGPLSNRNKIINGNFDVWQRGTSFTSTVSGTSAYTADRWKAGGGTSTTVSRQTFTLGQTDVPGEPTYYAQWAITNNSQNYEFQQRIEDVRTLAGQKATISFYARRTTGSITVGVRTVQYFGTGGSPSSSVIISAGTPSLTTSWQKFTYTVDIGSVSGKTLGSNNDHSLWLGFQVSDTNTGTIEIAQFQVEAGSVATPFEHRSYGDELARCQRYYQHFATDTANAVYLGMGIASGSTSARMFMPISVAMRTTPSITENGASADDQIDSTYALSSPSVIGSTASTVRVQFTTSGMTGGRPLQLQVGTGESITLSAEL